MSRTWKDENGRLRLPYSTEDGPPDLRVDEAWSRWHRQFFKNTHIPDEHQEIAGEDTLLVEEELVRATWAR